MAWVDDRIWCHPKFTDLSSPAFRAYINGLAYCAGMATGGRLTLAQQKLIGADIRVRNELVEARLWDRNGGRNVTVHDWKEHNEKRDARRAADRERKRKARQGVADAPPERPADSPADAPPESKRTGAPASTGTSTGTAHVDGSEGSEGKTKAVRSKEDAARAKALVDKVQAATDDIPF